jgi:hypothetical protein
LPPIDTVTYSPHVSSLWRNREFSLLWTSQSLSDLGDAVAQLAMPLLVLALTGSAVRAGLVGTVTQVVRLLTRLPGGPGFRTRSPATRPARTGPRWPARRSAGFSSASPRPGPLEEVAPA